MPTLHATEWTKDQLDEIKDEEDHSTYDSVLKTLLKESGRV